MNTHSHLDSTQVNWHLQFALLQALFALFLLFAASGARANTYAVNTSSCTGTGSLTEAMQLANTNPGPDTIRIDAGVTVSAALCGYISGQYKFILQAKESVVIEGAGPGAGIVGSNSWVTTGGLLTPLDVCPKLPDIITSYTPALILVGEPGADNSAIEVTLRNLLIKEVSGVAEIRENARLIVEDSKVERIFNSAGCDTQVINARSGAGFTSRNTHWSVLVNWQGVIAGVPAGLILGGNAGDLVIDRSTFDVAYESGLIFWEGQSGSEVNIVSSLFRQSDGVLVTGQATTNIVNSLFGFGNFGSPEEGQRIINSSSMPMNFVASTLVYPDAKCQKCATGEQRPGWIGRWMNAGPVNFRQTAIGVNFPNDPGAGELIGNYPYDTNQAYSADSWTWIQPTAQQDAAALRARLNQPALLTDPPGLPTIVISSDTIEQATPIVPGLLIEAIPGAQCGQVNGLVNPIDGSCIDKDILGNLRWDQGTGRRDIGAIQVSQIPALQVKGYTVDTVTVSWSKVTLPTVTGFQVEYRQVGAGTWTDGGQVSGSTLEKQIAGLSPGTRYEFRVTALTPAQSGWSNVVSETPRAVPGLPPGFALSAAGQSIQANWSPAAANGSPIAGYVVIFRPASMSPPASFSYLMLPDTATTTNLTGLTNGVTYEVAVYGVNGVGAGLQASGTATPVASPTLSYAAPSSWPQGTPLTLQPTVGSLTGTPSFTMTGSLPNGMSLDASGVIQGTPTATGTFSANIRLRDNVTALFVETAVTLTIVAPPLPAPSLVYPSPTYPAGASFTITPSVGNIAGTASYLLVSGNLPAGMNLNPSTGVIDGTPTTPGISSAIIRVTDSSTGLTTDAQILNRVIASASAPTLSYPAPASWPRDTPLTLQPSVGNLTGTPSYSITGGTLPSGMFLNSSSGIVSGTPSSIGTTSATIRVTDSVTTLSDSTNLTITITAPAPSPQLWYPTIQTVVGAGTVSAVPTQAGIPGNARWSVVAGESLPAGFNIDPATGVISGQSTAAPGRVLDIDVQACWGSCDPNLGEVRVAPILFYIVPRLSYPANSPATAGIPLTINPNINTLWTGGRFSLAPGGSLPNGMSLNEITGVISGTPLRSGVVTPFTVRYSTGVNVYTPPLEYVESVSQINVGSPTITLTYPDTGGPVGRPMTISPTLTGTSGQVLYTLSSATSLPSGLQLDPLTGIISGIPTGPIGTTYFVINVTDAYGTGAGSLAITLSAAPPPPNPIPSLSEWARISMMLSMLGIMGWSYRRVRR